MTGVTAVAAVAVALALGAVFLHPVSAVPGGSPEFPHPSATPMSSWLPMYAGDEAADYTAPRVAIGRLSGTDRPDHMCVTNTIGSDPSVCAATVPVTGLTWGQVPGQTSDTSGSRTTADLFIWGYFDGTSLQATAVSRSEDTNVARSNLEPSPAAPTSALITCDRTITGMTSPSGAPTPTYGSALDPTRADAAGLEAYWIEYASPIRLMVATSSDLDATALKVATFWDGPACIGRTPAQGPLTELLAAEKRVRDARIDGVASVGAATYPGGVLQVTVVANIPGLRERVVAVAGSSVSLAIVPLLATVHNETRTPSPSRS